MSLDPGGVKGLEGSGTAPHFSIMPSNDAPSTFFFLTHYFSDSYCLIYKTPISFF